MLHTHTLIFVLDRHHLIAATHRIVAFIMVALGFSSLCISVVIYFKNQRRIVHRLIDVGHGWAGYTMALLIMLFICFIMVVALTEVD